MSEFIKQHQRALEAYWRGVAPEIARWRQGFEWPRGSFLKDAIKHRMALQAKLHEDLQAGNGIGKESFDAVMQWGFNKVSRHTEAEIREATRPAFAHLAQGNPAAAARALMSLRGVGISTATKMLALSDHRKLAIYDSRVAHGLSDLVLDGTRALLIPPGYVVMGDLGVSKDRFADHYGRLIEILTFFQGLAAASDSLAADFEQVADLEIAFFARSRSGAIANNRPATPRRAAHPTLQASPTELTAAIPQAEAMYQTLGSGRPFAVTEDDYGVVFHGRGDTRFPISYDQLEACLQQFSHGEWFPLGASVAKPMPGGLGRYLKVTFGVAPLHASYLASYLVAKGYLLARGRRPVLLAVNQQPVIAGDRPLTATESVQ